MSLYFYIFASRAVVKGCPRPVAESVKVMVKGTWYITENKRWWRLETTGSSFPWPTLEEVSSAKNLLFPLAVRASRS